MSPFFDRKEQGADWRWAAALLAAFGALTAFWLLLSRPEENRLTGTRAFDLSGGVVTPRVPRAIERREETGLTMVHTGFVEPEEPAPAPEGSAAPQPPADAGPAPAAQPAPPAAQAAPAGPIEAASAQELGAAGIPTDARGLTRLGAQKGLLSGAVRKLIDHPRLLKALLDNQLVVDGLMGRETSRRNCSDPSALKSALSDTGSSAMRELMPLVQQALSRPESASAMVGSRLGKALMDCPSTKAVTSDPGMIMSVGMANPQLLQLASDPRVASALSTSPQGSGLFSGVNGALGRR